MSTRTMRIRCQRGIGLLVAVVLAACNFPAATALPVPSQPPGATPPGAANLKLEAQAIRAGQDAVTFSAILINDGDQPAGQVRLRWQAPSASGPAEVLGAPTEAQASQQGDLLTWELATIPPRTRVGPFAVRVGNVGESFESSFGATWHTPSPGEVVVPLEGAEDASLLGVTAPMSAGELTSLPQTGVRYFVPVGDLGEVSVTLRQTPPDFDSGEDLAWIAGLEVTKENPGSVILLIPLERPAVPYSSIRVFEDSGAGFLELPVMGTVTEDGMHAAFAADGSSQYALGIAAEGLSLSTAAINDEIERHLIDLALQGVVEIEGLLDGLGSLSTLIGSLRTDGIVIIGGDETWFVFDTPIYDQEPNECASDEFGLACSNGPDEAGPCSGHGGGVTNVDFETGVSESYCADGTTITECEDVDDDGYCANVDADDEDEDVHFAPVPGPCPHAVCFADTESQELFAMDELTGLAPSIAGVIEMAGLSVAERVAFPPPSSQQLQAGGRPGSDLRGIVGVIENQVVMLIPHGQSLEVALGLPPVAAPAPTATVAATVTATPIPPTHTPTLGPTETSPPPDSSGPSIKSVSDSPDPIKVTQPKGCTPTTSTVSAAITDPSGVASASLLFFHTTIGQLPMTHGGGSTWSATLGPFSGIGDGTVDYQIRAVDGEGNTADSSFGQITVLACIP